MQCFGKSETRLLHCKIILLDEQELIQDLRANLKGEELLRNVLQHLQLKETAYFGLRFINDSKQPQWLDPKKKVLSQTKGSDPLVFYFAVKFYAMDPCKIAEQTTRYQFFLQVKQDIVQGRLPLTREDAAQLGALALHTRLGEFDSERHRVNYVKSFGFLAHCADGSPNETTPAHSTSGGLAPAEAELRFLDIVKRAEFYGVDLHPVIGEDSLDYFLGLSPTGIVVLRNKNKVAHYFWNKISKIFIKGQYFMIRVQQNKLNAEDKIYGFELPSKASCKNLYKCCRQYQEFFSSPLLGSASNNVGKNHSWSSKIPSPSDFVKVPLDSVGNETPIQTIGRSVVSEERSVSMQPRPARSLSELGPSQRRIRYHSHSSKLYSDNESEVSRVSRSSHGRRRRSRSRDIVDSECECRSQRSSRKRDSVSGEQWRHIQTQQGSTSLEPTSFDSHLKPDSLSEVSSSRRRRRRRHRHRHRRHRRSSESEKSLSRRSLPPEIVPHLQFGLQEPPAGSTADQLREIPYQSVTTENATDSNAAPQLPDVLKPRPKRPQLPCYSPPPSYLSSADLTDSLSGPLRSLDLSSMPVISSPVHTLPSRMSAYDVKTRQESAFSFDVVPEPSVQFSVPETSRATWNASLQRSTRYSQGTTTFDRTIPHGLYKGDDKERLRSSLELILSPMVESAAKRDVNFNRSAIAAAARGYTSTNNELLTLL